ncbi:hypothetical protein ABW20_dc0100420 [Dactylellina cionopaga]|nr:hypothetical protein ABW20_dc0100420 [Dactylellina cionopaga]
MASDDDTIDGVFVVGTGENEGEFLFQYHPLNGEPSMISAIIVDISNYPTKHEVFIFGCGEDALPLGEQLSDMPSLTGKSVRQILTQVSQHLRSKEIEGSQANPFLVQDEDTIMQDASQPRRRARRQTSPMIIDDDQDDLYSTRSTVDKGKKPASALPTMPSPADRMVSDLRAIKDAGFKLGYHGSLKGSWTCYLIISCRLSRLGISDNALDAWHVESKRYLNMIIEYPAGYVGLHELCDEKKKAGWGDNKNNIRMRIRQSDKYKPTRAECQAAFKKSDNGKDMPYVFRSLEMFLNERLLILIKKRLDLGFSWFGTEEFFFLDKKQAGKTVEAMEAKFWHDDNTLGGFSRLITSDHFGNSEDPRTASFPLVAMQFFLRHFARYTDFCLVCHRRVTSDVEALEPYVCSTPDCLSKYLSSDFGPGIERDIVEQPYVVDLLVSFCYAAARHQKLKDFPDALNLKVPNPPTSGTAGYTGTFDRANKELTLRINAVNPISHPVQIGTWMAITGAGVGGETLCCRAIDMSLFPIIKVSDPISTTAQASALNMGSAYTGQSAAAAGSQQVTVNIYNQDFASLSALQKQECICLLLDTLPSVREMKDRLRQQHLSSWGDRISPAALGVLRWIVASNRACIVQVDGLETGSNGVFPATQTEDRVYGMGNWMQFRFAMGAPDKEQKFQTATTNAARRLRLKHPTLFAWHGSPLINWHAIIREGLNFNQTLNGRAYGNGCYHSMDFRTSLGYTANRHAAVAGGDQWSKSVLKVSAAVALNEIVNAPREFVSSSPHLVVAQLDWISTRYLFVQCAFSNQTTPASQKQPTQVKPQDPGMTPNGEQGKIVIPQPKAARARKDELLDANKKGKKGEPAYTLVTIDGIEERIPVEEDPASDATNDSDMEVFLDGTAVTGDSLEVNDLDVAIALSMEENMGGASSFSAPLPVTSEPTPRTTKKRGSLFSGFAFKGPRANEIRMAQNATATSTSPVEASTASSASPASATLPPSYDDVPMTNTPPSYTPVGDTSGTSGFFANTSTQATGVTDPPRYNLRSASGSGPSAASPVSAASPTAYQPQQATGSSSTASASPSGSRSGGFFGGFKRTLSNIGNQANTEQWSNTFSALPMSKSISTFGGSSSSGTTGAARPRSRKGKDLIQLTTPAVPTPAPFFFADHPPAPKPPVFSFGAPNFATPTLTTPGTTAPPVVAPVAVPVTAPVAAPVTAPIAIPAPVPVPVVPVTTVQIPPAIASFFASRIPAVKAPVAPAVTSTASSSTAVVSTPKAPGDPKVPMTDFVAGVLDYSTLPLISQPTFATGAATKRLQREYKNLLKTQETTPLHELGWYTNPDHFDNVYQWIVELHSFDSTLPLASDMKSRGIKSVVLELRFGASFPNTPPFVRVIKPRFLPFMNGGGGHVTIGGAVCLEMLTGTGWDSKTTIESILLNVRLAMMSTDPKPARLEYEGQRGGPNSSYGVSEAAQAYLRACRTHGWAVPKGFEEMAQATS